MNKKEGKMHGMQEGVEGKYSITVGVVYVLQCL